MKINITIDISPEELNEVFKDQPTPPRPSRSPIPAMQGTHSYLPKELWPDDLTGFQVDSGDKTPMHFYNKKVLRDNGELVQIDGYSTLFEKKHLNVFSNPESPPLVQSIKDVKRYYPIDATPQNWTGHIVDSHFGAKPVITNGLVQVDWGDEISIFGERHKYNKRNFVVIKKPS